MDVSRSASFAASCHRARAMESERRVIATIAGIFPQFVITLSITVITNTVTAM